MIKPGQKGKREQAGSPRNRGLRAVSIVLVIISFAIVFNFFAMPEIKYQIATRQMNNGQYMDAIEMFTQLSDYKDSGAQLVSLYDLVNQYVKVGAKVFYGTYEQDNSTTDGKEKIEWQVLALEGDTALLMSVKNLDCIPYHSDDQPVIWETCSLRAWLNDTFLKTAFSEEEQNAIKTTQIVNDDNGTYLTNGGNTTQDKIFLLSVQEANTYFGDDLSRIGMNTAYAVAKKAFNSPEGSGWWWLRSPGIQENIAANVNYSGSVDEYGNYIYSFGGAIRPVFWINQKYLASLS